MRALFTLFIMILSWGVKSQDRILPIFLLQNEDAITHYLDSLNKLSTNPYYKIKRSAADNGDLILNCGYSLSEQKLYKCLEVYARFTRINGVNICTTQLLSGSEEYSEDNLQFVKDAFTYVSDGKWKTKYPYDKITKSNTVFCEYERKNGEYPSFTITYTLANEKAVTQNQSDWIKIDELENSFIYSKLDEKYSNTNGQTIYRVWIKEYNYNTGLGGANENFITRNLIEFNCLEKKYKVIEVDIYDSDDAIRGKRPTVNPKWTQVEPNSNIGYYLSHACKLFNNTNPPK